MYKDRGYDDKTIDKAIEDLIDAEKFLKKQGQTFDDCDVGTAKEYIKSLIENHKNNLDTLLAAARYFYLIKNNGVYIYFTKILGGLGVIENITKRMETYVGKKKTDEVMEGYKLPPLGTALEDMPKFTSDLMRRLKDEINEELYQKILAGNNHGISEEAMNLEKEFYENSNSLDDYLSERHKRKVEELQSYCDSETVWYEQIITQEVVDFVAANQEILSAKREGNKLYVTKIPYDVVNYLKETDLQKKRYYACHCPFAREGVMTEGENVDGQWCYCSAGFAKFPFEVIFSTELEIKLLKSPLLGDKICRFEIDMGDYKFK